ncbi:MAG: DNA gyrase subunit A [Candidatus ainarchaeum sp.]|nr:DNA gyrase subunit A [Candidatus ainarchaeum sp.]
MEKTTNRPIENDMKESYMDYAMSVIVGRALPDVRDGLKPVHRRILFTMHDSGNLHNKPYKKSARIIGDTLGRFHPHGDAAIYDSLVRMAQNFSLRYPLVDGQGNFGSIDGDNAAAFRYTEVRMSLISEEILEDINKETVDFVPNFDTTLKEPVVLPSKIPNLLINGSSGIAVGMATNIPPHNINEITDALISLIDGEDKISVLSKIKGPDFPTGGIIVGHNGIREAYATGKGKILVRSRCEIDEEKNSIVITEIPYQITKTSIIEKIVECVKEGRIEGIRGVHDHSDKEGITVVVELKKGENPEVILNQLYKHTPLQTTFGIINLVLVNNEPKCLDMHSLLNEFIEFRKEIITRKSKFELAQAEDRAHILEGLRKAIENIDEVVPLLRKSKDPEEAISSLIQLYSLSEKQAKAILDMKLSKLISLEREKLIEEYNELIKIIAKLKEILSDINKVLAIIKEELIGIRAKYGDSRRTEIIEDEEEFELEELIPNEESVVTISHRGYIKRVGLGEYKEQKRGGKGVIGSETKEDDIIDDILVTKTHNHLLFFSNKGKVYWLKTYRIPEAGRYSSGKAIVNLLELSDKDEKITAWVSVSAFSEQEFLSMITKRGIVKRTSIMSFSKPRKGGIIAINLRENDELNCVLKTNGKEDIFIATKNGLAIRFKEEDARELGRTGMGVIGIRLKENDEVASAGICNKPAVITITENGYGKRTSINEYRLQGRGGHGVINIKTQGRNGSVVGAKTVEEQEHVIVVSSKGQTIRVPVSNISVIGRNTQGVRIIKLKENEKVASFAVIKSEFLDSNGQNSETPPTSS